MIGYLRGTVLEIREQKILVLVQGVGYSVAVPARIVSQWSLGQEIELFIHTHVREDALDLFGFATAGDKEVFLALLHVNGVGPKAAMNLVSNLETQTLLDSIVLGDSGRLTQVPGIGKKTAERIVLDLSDLLRKKIDSGVFSSGASRVLPGMQRQKAVVAGQAVGAAGAYSEAHEALISLGYREGDASAMLERAKRRTNEMDLSKTPTSEDWIRWALKEISN